MPHTNEVLVFYIQKTLQFFFLQRYDVNDVQEESTMTVCFHIHHGYIFATTSRQGTGRELPEYSGKETNHSETTPPPTSLYYISISLFFCVLPFRYRCGFPISSSACLSLLFQFLSQCRQSTVFFFCLRSNKRNSSLSILFSFENCTGYWNIASSNWVSHYCPSNDNTLFNTYIYSALGYISSLTMRSLGYSL